MSAARLAAEYRAQINPLAERLRVTEEQQYRKGERSGRAARIRALKSEIRDLEFKLTELGKAEL